MTPTLLRILSAFSSLLLVAAACGGGGSAPGGAGGVCRQIGVPCDDGLICEDGICTPPGGFGAPDAGSAGGDHHDSSSADARPDSGVSLIPDAGQPPGGGDCDPVAQTGCVAGEHCTAVWDGFALTVGCHPNGSIPPGGSCAETTGVPDDCSDGSYCFEGSCRPLCDFDTGQRCAGTCLGLSGVVGICMQACDPLAQACPGGEACYLYEKGGACLPAGTTPVGSACSYTDQCVSGAICERGAGRCEVVCDAATYPGINDPVRCDPAQVCTAFTDLPSYGICQ